MSKRKTPALQLSQREEMDFGLQIELSQEMRKEYVKFCTTGNHSVKLANRAKIILELDESNGRKPLTQEAIAEKIGVSRQ